MQKRLLSFVLILFCGSLCFSTQELAAKEQLFPVLRNPKSSQSVFSAGTRSDAERRFIKQVPPFEAFLQLPFLDDFSRSDDGAPLSRMWNKAQVCINDGYALNPPTPYVATFDALNAQGELYAQASYDPFGADTLCSHAFALSAYSETDSVTLFFQIQAGGKGAFPSPTDSLCLEFYNPALQEWQSVWSAKAYTLNQQAHHLLFTDWLSGVQKEHTSNANSALTGLFFPVRVHLHAAFLSDGFSFRFRNVASLTRLDAVPGMVGNTDHWNLCTVVLNTRAAGDTVVFRDVLLMQPQKSVLNAYTSVPWKHFKDNSAARLLLLDEDRVQRLTMRYRSAEFRPLQVSRQFIIQDLSFPSNRYQTESLWDRLETGESFEFVYRGYDFSFASPAQDSVDFRLTSVLSYSGAQLPYTLNDTLSYVQKFRDYYAYDDDDAENGYGLFGRWAGGSKVAIKFNNVLPAGDTLKGMYVYFNRVFEQANQHSFRLAVWNDFNGYPGTRLYDSISVLPGLEYGRGGWEYFAFTKPLVVRGDFYIGWEQVGEEMLNVGFDHNCVVAGKHFVNEGAGWILSEYNGTGIPMLRPAFGSFVPRLTGAETDITLKQWKVYPNPARETVFVQSASGCGAPVCIDLFSINGKRVRSWKGGYEELDLSGLLPGSYFIRIEDASKRLHTQLILIQ